MIVWLALDVSDRHNTSVMGIFSTEEKAVSVCSTQHHVIGPVNLDEYVAEEVEWRGAYFPFAQDVSVHELYESYDRVMTEQRMANLISVIREA